MHQRRPLHTLIHREINDVNPLFAPESFKECLGLSVESESEEGFKERALAVGLAAKGDNFWDWELFPEGYYGDLEAVVGLKSRFRR